MRTEPKSIMRKRIIAPIPQGTAALNAGLLNLDSAAMVEVTSEDKDYPVESALVSGETRAGVPPTLELKPSG